MVEIVFGDSACASLKMAQHYGEGEYRSGCVGVIVSHSDGRAPTESEIENARREVEERMRSAWESATPMGGSIADIYGFGLAWSIGDISEKLPGIKRKQVLMNLYSVYPDDEGNAAAEELFKRANEDLSRVKERAAAKEPFRIWYSDHPDELCGLYWFMSLLDQWKAGEGQINTVKLPEWETDEKGNVVRIGSWSEVAPEQWHSYLELDKPVPIAFIQNCASYWQELKRENAPLRAVLNGRLVSAREDIYDEFILREIAAESGEFQEAMIIGRVLGKYRLGISDCWAAQRIEKMIRAGNLEIVSSGAENMPAYHRVLKRLN